MTNEREKTKNGKETFLHLNKETTNSFHYFKEIKYAVIIVEVIQIIIKLSRREEKSEGLTNIDDKETIVKKNSEIIENDDCETLAAMIKIAVSDKNVTDEEMEMLKKQAIIASVSEEKLQQRIFRQH